MGAPLGRADRRRLRTPRVLAEFGKEDTGAALDVLELLDLAWHDCYGEPEPPEAVLDDVLVYAQGSVARLAHAAIEGVNDYRDLRLAADDVRHGGR